VNGFSNMVTFIFQPFGIHPVGQQLGLHSGTHDVWWGLQSGEQYGLQSGLRTFVGLHGSVEG